ncbi:MAG: carboxypeptidase-like regulatory domain-containing protein [Candidatus Diapherotrites archaeon]|nr:carboxypeptidase-like regulatory domain-containing protein [Candidatus Diapherotrites archaeon]
MALDFLKNIYFSFEDKWYNLLDKIDAKMPVYHVIDKIDEIIPSFVLFLLSIVFLLVLVGYLLNFSSNYEAMIITKDGDTGDPLPGVKLYGSISGTPFMDKVTGAEGKATLSFAGEPVNFFGMIGKIILPSKETFSALISAEKTGYGTIEGAEIDLGSLQYEMKLYQIKSEFLGAAEVLFEDESGNTIVEESSLVKYVCANSPGTKFTVNDSEDGDTDGSISLARDECQFQIVDASADGYIAVTSLPKILTDSSTTIVLRKNNPNTKGTLTVNLYKGPAPSSGATPEQIVDPTSATISIYKDGDILGTYLANSRGSYTKSDLDPGAYSLTVNHPSYYTQKGIEFEIKVSPPKEVNIYLEFINPLDRRRINLVVTDSSTGAAIPGALVALEDMEFDFNNAIAGTGLRETNQTDSNGKVILCNPNGGAGSSSCTVRDRNVLVVTVYKEGYLYSAFVPTLKETSSTEYDSVKLEKATASNSGTVEVGVKQKSNLKPLIDAKTWLYYDFCITSPCSPTLNAAALRTIKLYPERDTTVPYGKATYSGMMQGTYRAKASYGGAVSVLSDTNNLYKGGIIFFDLNVDTSLSTIKVLLYNGITEEKLSDSAMQSADVNIYISSSTDYSTLVSAEKMVFDSSSHLLASSLNYDSSKRLMIKANASGFVSTSVPIEPGSLAVGSNEYAIKMYPSNLDGNINIFFDQLYNVTDDPWKGKDASTVTTFSTDSTNGKHYYVKLDIVINKEVSYQELLSMADINIVSKSNGTAEMISIPSKLATPFYYNPPSPSVFTCRGSQANCSATVCDDNYYFPTTSGCFLKNVQVGTDWKNDPLPTGVYSFAVDFLLGPTALKGDTVTVGYRAKEKHTSFASQTELKKVMFVVGKPVKKGIYFDVSIKDTAVDLTQLTSGVPAGVIASQGTSSRVLVGNQFNKASISVCNNSGANISFGNLVVFSAATLDLTVIGKPGFSGSGYLYIDDQTVQMKTFPVGTIVSGECSSPIDMLVYSSKLNKDNWLVMDTNSSGKIYAALVSTHTLGSQISLDAEFLARFPDQNFDGYVYLTGLPGSTQPISDKNLVKLGNASVTVYRNCRGTGTKTIAIDPYGDTHPPLVGLIAGVNSPADGYFWKNIPGVYVYNVDCLDINASAVNPDFEMLSATLYAGRGQGPDPSLACVDAVFAGVPNITEESETTLEWGANATLIVTNNCVRDVVVKLETDINASTLEITIPSLAGYPLNSHSFNINGMNKGYLPLSAKPDPNFTDILGFFPILVKAKFAGTNKRFVMAERAIVHLTRPSDCFVISKDSFDLISNASEAFSITNSCRKSIGTNKDSETPKVAVDSFGLTVGPGTANPGTAANYGCNVKLTSGGTAKEITLGTYSVKSTNGITQTLGTIDYSIFSNSGVNNPTTQIVCAPADSSLFFWIEGGYLNGRYLGIIKARYFGTNNTPIDSSGKMDFLLNKGTSSGTNYSIINITDYVNKGRAK